MDIGILSFLRAEYNLYKNIFCKKMSEIYSIDLIRKYA